MTGRKRKSKSGFLLKLGLFIIILLIVFFGIQFVTKTGIFHVPGVVIYDESLSESEIEKLSSIFTEDIELDKDVTISAAYSFNKPELGEGAYLESIEVPVADFYSTDTNINIESPELLYADPYVSEVDYEMTGIDELDSKVKLLSINDDYYLDELDSGAVFRTITFKSEKFAEEILPLVDEEFSRSFPTSDTVLTFAQTGVTALSRGMNAKLYSVGDATYFAENVKSYLSGFDLTHTSNESSFADSANADNICSDKRFINTLTAIGLDIVELTGNHNQDCGNQAALYTLDIYDENNIQVVGGGRNSEEAAKPLEISQKGNNITFLAYNLSTGGATYGDAPGANQYYEENAVSEINSAKERGDFVIVDIQYYECSNYVFESENTICDYANSSAGDQVGFFRHLIDLGADLVVGTSAHQPQTFETYGDGVIYYGLGNLFFDQYWWPGTTRSLILSHYFYNGKLLQTKLVPTVYDINLQTSLMDEEDAKWFVSRLIQARP